MSPTSRVPGVAAVDGLPTGCAPGSLARLYALGWHALRPSARIQLANQAEPRDARPCRLSAAAHPPAAVGTAGGGEHPPHVAGQSPRPSPVAVSTRPRQA